MKMYAYKVYDFDYDDTKSFILHHSKKFTKEEYENIVNTCRKKVTEIIEKNSKIIDSGVELSEEQAEEMYHLSGEWDIYDNIYKSMIKDYGFVEIKENIEYTFTLHGGYYGKGQNVENRVMD